MQAWPLSSSCCGTALPAVGESWPPCRSLFSRCWISAVLSRWWAAGLGECPSMSWVYQLPPPFLKNRSAFVPAASTGHYHPWLFIDFFFFIFHWNKTVDRKQEIVYWINDLRSCVPMWLGNFIVKKRKKKKKKAGQKKKSEHDTKTFDGKEILVLQNALNPQGLNTRTLWTPVLKCSSLHLNPAIPRAYIQILKS